MLLFLVVVPAALSHKLSQDLDGGLCTEFLFLWHIEIVNENDALHTETGSINIRSNLINLGVYDILYLVTVGLG